MADYNYNDINDAKKRVREMQNRVREKTAEEKSNELISLISGLHSQKDKALIISLLYLLSNKEADDELIVSILAILL